MSLENIVQYLLIPSGLVSFIVCGVLGWFVYHQNPKQALNRFFAAFAWSISGWSVGSFLENVIPDQKVALWVLRLCYLFAVFLPTLFLQFSSVVAQQVDRWRGVVRVAYGCSILFVPFIFTDIFIQDLRVIEPYGYRVTAPGPLYGVFFIFFSLCLVTGLWLIYRRIEEVRGQQQRQIQYIFLSHLIAFCAGIEYFSRVFRIVDFPPVDDYLLVVYFVVFAYAVVRHQLLDIQVVISRSLVYSLLIATITATYLVMVLIMERVFQGFLGYRSILATGFVAFLIAVFFNPLRNRIQAFVDRALFKGTPPELAEQREQLLIEVRKGEQQKAIATLAASLAHEVKNPLAAIKTFIGYLPEKHMDPVFLEKFQKIVGSELDKMHAVVQNLLTFAKPQPALRTPIPVEGLVKDTLSLLSAECHKRKVRVEMALSPELKLLGDRCQLQQALLNLCLNSLEAMPDAGVLRVSTAQQNGSIVLTVQDTGQGIAADLLPRIFEPFVTTKSNGTGLGLSVVQGIIRDHGGKIDISSTLGQGTTVYVRLPRLTRHDLQTMQLDKSKIIRNLKGIFKRQTRMRRPLDFKKLRRA